MIGTVIGTTESGLPFIAETQRTFQISADDKQKLLKVIWNYSILQIRESLKAFFVCGGMEIRATPIKDITKTDNVITFECEGLEVCKPLTFSKIGLILPNNDELIRMPLFNYDPIFMLPGDVLYGKCHIRH